MNPGNRRIFEHQNFTLTHDDAAEWWCIHNVKPTHAHASPGWWWNEHHNPVTHDDDGNVRRHRKQPFCSNKLIGRVEFTPPGTGFPNGQTQIIPQNPGDISYIAPLPPSQISLGKIQGVDYIFN